jgi:serine/threonine-protein kinase
MIFGTPDYMSPEQAEGKKPDHRVDIYSLGVILYQAVVGRLPFEAESFMGVLTQHMSKAPPPPREICPDISPEVEALILKSLTKDRDQRYQTMEEFAAAMEAIEDASASPAATPEIASPPVREKDPMDTTATVPTLPGPEAVVAGPRRSLAVPVIIAVLLIGLAGGGFIFWKMRGDKSSEEKGKAPPPPTQMQPPVAAMTVVDAAAPMVAMVEPPKPRTVTITVKTNKKAKVFLGDQRLGTTPLEKKKVAYSEEEKVLRIERKGYKTLEIRFTPNANQSWDRILKKGRGKTQVVAVMKRPTRPRPMDMVITVMRKPPMRPMRRLPMELKGVDWGMYGGM